MVELRMTPAPLQTLRFAAPETLLSLWAPLALEPDTVHVWAFMLTGTSAGITHCRGLLSPDERKRADRFIFERDRLRHTIAHGVLRQLLSRYCNRAPEKLEFAVTSEGKPSLLNAVANVATPMIQHAPAPRDASVASTPPRDTPAHVPTLTFNLSHSDDRALLGVSFNRELGVDVERVRSNIEALAISEHYFFGAEREAIANAPSAECDNMFFRYWVAKEAVLKAQGIGLGFPLDRFRVDFQPDGHTARIATFDPARLAPYWTLRLLPCEPGWFAAVAASGTAWNVKLEQPTS